MLELLEFLREYLPEIVNIFKCVIKRHWRHPNYIRLAPVAKDAMLF